jgi:hypothetical protein
MLILKMCSWDMGNILDNNEIMSLEGNDMVIILTREVIIGTKTIITGHAIMSSATASLYRAS